MSITQWHVPVDDTHCYWYAIFTSFTTPVDKATMRAQRLQTHALPDYAPHANQSNDWGYDPEQQRTTTYTGMGTDINTCMTNGLWKAWGPFRIARKSISDTRIESSRPPAA
jgi:phthalate 4,5-dioxygenase oxygenase subunit